MKIDSMPVFLSKMAFGVALMWLIVMATACDRTTDAKSPPDIRVISTEAGARAVYMDIFEDTVRGIVCYRYDKSSLSCVKMVARK